MSGGQQVQLDLCSSIANGLMFINTNSTYSLTYLYFWGRM